MIHNTTVTTAAASRSLVQQATVTGELPSGADTARVDSLIVSASQAIARYLNREPWLATYQTKLPGRGGYYLKLPRWPIQSVTSVTDGLGDSPTTVTASTYSVAGNTRRDRLYREDGWGFTRDNTWRPMTSSSGPALVYTVAYVAGWVMPDQITEWSSGGSITSGAWYASTDDDEPFIFQAGGAGTFDTTEPAWPTASGGTVTDTGSGTVTFTAYDQRLPQELEEIALALVLDWYEGAGVPSGLASESFAGMRRDYRAATSSVPSHVAMTLAAYR